MLRSRYRSDATVSRRSAARRLSPARAPNLRADADFATQRVERFLILAGDMARRRTMLLTLLKLTDLMIVAACLPIAGAFGAPAPAARRSARRRASRAARRSATASSTC